MSEQRIKSGGTRVVIGTRIALMFGAATLIVMTVLVMIVITMTSKALNTTTSLYASGIAQARAGELSATIGQYMRFAVELASRDVTIRGDFKEIAVALGQRKTATGEFVLGTFFANESGDYVTDLGMPGNVGDRDYFQSVMKNGASWAVGSPVISRTLNVPIVVIAAPVLRGSQRIGMIGVQVALSELSQSVADINIDNAGYGFLIDTTGLVVAHPDASLVMEANFLQSEALGYTRLTALIKKMVAGETGSGDYLLPDKTAQHVFYAPVPDSGGWSLGIAVPDSYIMRSSVELALTVIVIGIVALAIIVLVSILVGRSISVPVKAAVDFAAKISGGELRHDIPVEYKRRRDEIGDLALALQDMLNRLRVVLSEVASASVQVSDGSNQLSGTSQQMSQGATEQASSVEEISASMEQMTANIRQNADNALQTEKIARRSAMAAADGGKAVGDTLTAMKEIAAKISIIEEIARSTNMLSLNASIEAARAGEFGKGFAVVASEVGKLAERSQRESGEISKLSLDSVSIAERAGKTIADMIPEIQRTAELVQEISAASNEQNSGAGQINSAIMQLDKVVQQNAAASEESASMAEELSSQSEQLQEAIAYFKIDHLESTLAVPEPTKKKLQQTVSVEAKKKVVVKVEEGKPSPSEKKPTAPSESKPVKSSVKPASSVVTETKKPVHKPEKREPVSGIVLNLDDENRKPARDKLDSEYEEF